MSDQERQPSEQSNQEIIRSSCMEGEEWATEEVQQKELYEKATEGPESEVARVAYDGVADVLIQAGHYKHNSWDSNTGAESRWGREIDWTPIVCDEAARILAGAGVSVIKTDARIKTRKGEGPGKMFKVAVAVFIHFDGGGGTTGASIGYDHDSDKPAADDWKKLYSKYWKYKWMDDNYTKEEHHYYGFAHTVTTDAELVLELGDLEGSEQAHWLKPRLKWLGALVAHFLSARIQKGDVPDPGPYT